MLKVEAPLDAVVRSFIRQQQREIPTKLTSWCMMQSDRWSANVLPRKKTISDSDRFKGTKENVFLENVGVLSDRWWWWCGVWGTGYMLDAVIVLGLLSNPRPWALKQPTPSRGSSLSPSPSVCPEDRHPDSTRSHYLPSYIYYNSNNNKSRNITIMIIIATMTNHSCFWNFFSAQLDVLLAVKIKSVARHTMYFLKSHNCSFSTIICYCCYLPCPIYVKLYKIRIQRNIRLSRVSVVL